MQIFHFEGFFYNYIGTFKEGKIEDLWVQTKREAAVTGDVFQGKIQGKISGQGAYFVDIGMDKPAYLQGSNMHYAVGDEVLIQIKQEARASKGPKATTKVSLQGEGVVVLKGEHTIFVSQKIKDKLWSESICQQLEAHKDSAHGIIVRTNAYTMNQTSLIEELKALELLIKSWSIMKYPFVANRVFSPKTQWEKHITSLLTQESCVVYTNKRHLKHSYEKHHAAVELVDDFFGVYELHDQLRRLLAKRYAHKSGIELVVDELEALTAIDVNSSSFKSVYETVEKAQFEMNRSAIEGVLDLIKLKNLSGMILIDFIDMSKSDRDEIKKSFKEGMVSLGLKDIDVKGFTRLGILEMTRKREDKSLTTLLCTDNQLRGERENTAEYLIDQGIAHIKNNLLKGDTFLIEASSEVYAVMMNYRSAIKAEFSPYHPRLLLKCTSDWLNRMNISMVEHKETLFKLSKSIDVIEYM